MTTGGMQVVTQTTLLQAQGATARATEEIVAAPQPSSAAWRGVRRAFERTVSATEWLFGLVSLVVALAVLATLPVLQFLSLGYLLEVGGRVVRERRLASGIVGVRKAARVGGVVLGAWLVLLPLRFASLMVDSARLIAAGQPGRSGLDVGAMDPRAALDRPFDWRAVARRPTAGFSLAPADSAGKATGRARRLPRGATRFGSTLSACGCHIISGWDCAVFSAECSGWSFR